ncbi:hypothetical protein E4U17_002699 [Claviceps sp. LM77 group G4]|nr:hypothetical protein E4U17_002699 [Claviceps sp. LM77 group G4]KAG6086824.1 hypothetical protein E4U33_000067 [Claviceps sp. LM78 group G4]
MYGTTWNTEWPSEEDVNYGQLHQDLEYAGNFLPSHEGHNQPRITPMISGTLEEDGAINGEALDELSWAQIGNAMSHDPPHDPEDLSVAITTDAPHAMDSFFMLDQNGDFFLDQNGDFFASSMNNDFGQYPYNNDLRDPLPDWGAMPFFPAEPPAPITMQSSETNVGTASTAWLGVGLDTEFTPHDIETGQHQHPETEIGDAASLELGDLPPVSQAASLTRHGSKGKNGSKLLCPDCVEKHEGFRGKHELQRHQRSKHGTYVKKFLCRDPTEAGLVSKLSVIEPLSGCNVCVMKKMYGTDYNAAQHLRNGHFQKKSPRNRNRNSVMEPGDEERAGQGGEKQGPMIGLNDLRPWIREVTIYRGEDCEASNAEYFSMDDNAANEYAEIAN